MGRMREEVLLYWLSKEGHIAKLKYDVLMEAYGCLEELFWNVKKGRFLVKKGLGEALYSRLLKFADYSKLEAELGEYQRKGIGFVTYFSKDYPEKLKNIYSPPLCLYYRGRLVSEKERVIAIVGSRAASEKGLFYAGKIAKELSENGVGIISGMALGIDAASHIGCMEGKAKTYAILGSGVDICYPKCNFNLYMRIIENGAVISEFPPGTEPLKTNFPLRNRIISGLSEGVLVVEARKKSGSLITADLGLEQGKNIYAMPGDADFPLSNGTNQLIQMGAKLVIKVDDILEDMDFDYKTNHRLMEKELKLSEMERLIYSVIDVEPRHISAITEETGVGGAELFSILFHLELLGFVKRVGFEYYVIS